MKRRIVLLTLLAMAFQPAMPAENLPRRPDISLEDIAKVAVEQVLTHFLEARTTVGGIRLDLGEQILEIKNLRVANPRGFSRTPVIEAELAQIEADPKLLFAKEPSIRLVKLKGASINAEQNFSHGVNLEKLVKSVSRIKGLKLLPKSGEKKWTIEKGVIEDCAFRFSSPLVGQGPYERRMDHFEMSLAGPNGQGLTTQEALTKVLRRFMDETQPALLSKADEETQPQPKPKQPLAKIFDLLGTAPKR